ncbi:hypothetical protein GTY65_36800 [Streptomyces sp. SID8379]|uniref:hypothetical protein n=1 Tax=unclassified Streptomyces TaxID=2593676 RepID=UPI0003764649|nr:MULTISPECIES: hypothetical protein [unclassified Streptomyces]MYW69586.1 hypothetical protein [Streptomyces sp. SID8379]
MEAARRGAVLRLLLDRAESDGAVTGAALTGSGATGADDRWSDIDLVLGVREAALPDVRERWTLWLYEEFGALHHWDLGATVRVFLLPGPLEVDLTFAPESQFGPRGPQWRTVFGTAADLPPFAEPDPNVLAGLGWHHALHARVCVERGRWWQAEHWIGALREHLITLACLRLGLPTAYTKGAHLLPDAITGPLEATLVRSLTEDELRRALAVARGLFLAELERGDPGPAARLRPALTPPGRRPPAGPPCAPPSPPARSGR